MHGRAQEKGGKRVYLGNRSLGIFRHVIGALVADLDWPAVLGSNGASLAAKQSPTAEGLPIHVRCSISAESPHQALSGLNGPI